MKFFRNPLFMFFLMFLMVLAVVTYPYTKQEYKSPYMTVLKKLDELDAAFIYSPELTLIEKSVCVFNPKGGGDGFVTNCIQGNIIYVFSGVVEIKNLPEYVKKIDDPNSYEYILKNIQLFQKRQGGSDRLSYSIFVLKYIYPNNTCW